MLETTSWAVYGTNFIPFFSIASLTLSASGKNRAWLMPSAMVQESAPPSSSNLARSWAFSGVTLSSLFLKSVATLFTVKSRSPGSAMAAKKESGIWVSTYPRWIVHANVRKPTQYPFLLWLRSLLRELTLILKASTNFETISLMDREIIIHNSITFRLTRFKICLQGIKVRRFLMNRQ